MSELPCDSDGKCPFSLDKDLKTTNTQVTASVHELGMILGRLEALERRTEEMYSTVILGKYTEPLVTIVSKLAENGQEDREKLDSLEKKIEKYQVKQMQDLMEIKDAIHNLGLLGLIFKSNSGKFILAITVFILTVLFGFNFWALSNSDKGAGLSLDDEEILDYLIEKLAPRLNNHGTTH